MQATLKLLQTPATLDSSELNRIRLQSGVRHKIADETAALLRSLHRVSERPSVLESLIHS